MKQIENIENINFSRVEDMSYMFSFCSSLEDLNLSGCNANEVKDMSMAFAYLQNPSININLDNFSALKVTNLYGLFYAGAFTQIDLSTFKINEVTNMTCMFQECYNLKEIKFGSFNTNSVKDFESMFCKCSNLEIIDLENFDTSNAENMGSMFRLCESLVNIDLSNFNTKNVIDIGSMFEGCENLEKLDLSNFDTSNVEKMGGMFAECNMENITGIKDWDVRKVNSFYKTFYAIKGDVLDISNWDISPDADIYGLFDKDAWFGTLTITVYVKNEDIKKDLENRLNANTVTFIVKTT